VPLYAALDWPATSKLLSPLWGEGHLTLFKIGLQPAQQARRSHPLWVRVYTPLPRWAGASKTP